MIRTKMFIKYARMHLQEAEVAIQEESFQKAHKKCRDCAISLVKAVKEAHARCSLELDPIDMKALGEILEDLMDSRERAQQFINTLQHILMESDMESPSRIDAEKLLSLTGQAFQEIHDLFSPPGYS